MLARELFSNSSQRHFPRSGDCVGSAAVHVRPGCDGGRLAVAALIGRFEQQSSALNNRYIRFYKPFPAAVVNTALAFLNGEIL